MQIYDIILAYMAKKDTEEEIDETTPRQGKKNKNGKNMELKEETRYSIWGIGFIVLGILILLSIFNMAGVVGDFIYRTFSAFFGFGYYILPILLVAIGYSFLKNEKPQIAR